MTRRPLLFVVAFLISGCVCGTTGGGDSSVADASNDGSTSGDAGGGADSGAVDASTASDSGSLGDAGSGVDGGRGVDGGGADASTANDGGKPTDAGAPDGSTAGFVTTFPRSNPIPQSGPASTIDYVDLVGGGGKDADAVGALQGFANKPISGASPPNPPAVFVNARNGDSAWFQQMQTNYNVAMGKTLTPAQFLSSAKYAPLVSSGGKVKVIVYDPTVYSSTSDVAPELNIALSLAGPEGALPVSTSEWAAGDIANGTVDIDLTTTTRPWASCGDTKLCAYQWAFHYYDSKGGPPWTKKFFVMNPNGWTELADYIVENNAFVFSFNDTASGEPTTTELSWITTDLVPYYPKMTPIMGWFGLGNEVGTIAWISTSSNAPWIMQGGRVPDLSVSTGLPIFQNGTQPAGRNLTYSASKTYVAFLYTQGDDLAYSFYDIKTLWDEIDTGTGQPYHTEVPKTWMTCAFAPELAPHVIRYYYSSLSQADEFITGASGAGYVNPDLFSPADLATYAENTARLAKNIDLRTVWINTHLGSNIACGTDATMNRVTQGFLSAFTLSALGGFFVDQPVGKCDAYATSVVVGGKTQSAPVLTKTVNFQTVPTASAMAQQLNGLASAGPGTFHFIMVFFNFSPTSVSFVLQVQQALQANYPNVVLVRASEIAALERAYLGI
jgi:hypothetical protein